MNKTQKQGFSSQQQVNLQTVNGQQNNLIDEHQHQKIRINALHNVNPAQEIKKKQYSLEPDMMTGWKPKIYIPKPIPLIFFNDQLDYAIQRLIKMKTFKQEISQQNFVFIQLVYLGPRYQSTYSAWYQKPFDFPYRNLNKNKRLKFTDREFVGQYWNAQTQNHLHFDSFFQSGNLDVVFKIGQLQYDLFMRVDSNTRGHLQWYNFKVKNMKKGNIYTFNICNFSKGKSLYTRGMKPFICSKKLYQTCKIQWTQNGKNIKYEKKTPKSFKICKMEIDQKPYRLSFQYECEYDNDQIQFAYCIPYEYSRLKSYLQNLENKCSGKEFLKVSRLTYTLGGLDMPVITITQNLNERTDRENSIKKLIVASGRIHPGQSNGSFMMEGLINYLCSDTQQCRQLRSCIVFKIIPMVNPDGVVLGNYRTSLSGKDLNRQFINPDEYIIPQIYHLKKYIWKLRSMYKKEFLMYLDLHGHSTKKNCLTYGPEFSITNNNYYQCRIFPKLISMQTQMFRYFSCIFKISECKQRTLRAVLLKSFEIQMVYTVQVSNGCFYNHQLFEDILFDDKKWVQMGQKIGKSINQYIMIFRQMNKLKQSKKQERRRLRKDKEKYKLRNTFVKRQNGLFTRQKLSLSTTKTPFNSKIGAEQSSVSKFSPTKRKVHGYQNSQIAMSQRQFQNSINFLIPDEQNSFFLLEFQDQKLNFLLKQIYEKPNNNKSLLSRNSRSNSPQKEEKQSNRSDDNISEGGSDSSSSSQDLNESYKKQLFKSIKSGSQKIHSIHLPKKKKTYTQISTNQSPLQNSQGQSILIGNQTDIFFTQIGDSSNQIEDFRQQNKLNSLKLNQLRSKRHIYLKKKSYQLNITPSPKKQASNAHSANIVTFQFALNPIRPASHIWHQKDQTKNTIHSLFKQNSKQKINEKSRNMSSFGEYMNQNPTQRSEQRSQNLSNLKKKAFNNTQQNSFSLHNIPLNKQYNMVMLRKTQQRKMNINPTFYKAVLPNQQIQEDNLKGQRIVSSSRKERSRTEAYKD